jgi:hypothetical protein
MVLNGIKAFKAVSIVDDIKIEMNTRKRAEIEKDNLIVALKDVLNNKKRHWVASILIYLRRWMRRRRQGRVRRHTIQAGHIRDKASSCNPGRWYG